VQQDNNNIKYLTKTMKRSDYAQFLTFSVTTSL